MKVKVIENADDKLKVEIDDLTLVNLLNEKIWKQRGIEFAAYRIEHPYLSKPVLTVKSRDPKKTVLEAADKILDDVKELRAKLEKAMK